MNEESRAIKAKTKPLSPLALNNILETVGAQAVETHKDLRRRVQAINNAFQTEPKLAGVMQQLAAEMEQDIRQVVQWRYGPAVYREVHPPPPRRR